MKFLKVHGLGNDFVLVDAREDGELLSRSPAELSGLAVKICHRHFGVGADGLVLLRHAGDAGAYMQIINSDGSEAEMCGNAIRCVAKYIFEKDGGAGTRLSIKTKAGIMFPEIITQNGLVDSIRVDMGEPELERRKIPMLGEPGRVVGERLRWEGYDFKITVVSMGNPHCVIFVPDVEKVPLSLWGPGIENHSAFPKKTNVEFVQVLGRNVVAMRVWERGAGPTMACGTGACAAVVACVLNGYTDREAGVDMAAGRLLIEWNEDNNRVHMTGPAEFVFEGEYLLDKQHSGRRKDC